MNAQADQKALLDFVLNLGRRLLMANGEMFPLGAAIGMEQDSVVEPAEIKPSSNHPNAQEVIDLLTRKLSGQAITGEIRAAAILCDVRLPSPWNDMEDALRVDIEHRDAKPTTAMLPYRKIEDDYSFGEIFAVEGDARIF